MGKGIHMENASMRAMSGAIINNMVEEVAGWSGSLINSLRASAIG